MTFINKLLAEFDEIVDLAIEDKPERIILIFHGLETVWRKIDYSKAPVDEAGTTTDMQTLSIRTAMEKLLRHGCKELTIRLSIIIAILTSDPAHSPDC
jgi:hypothetical protein